MEQREGPADCTDQNVRLYEQRVEFWMLESLVVNILVLFARLGMPV